MKSYIISYDTLQWQGIMIAAMTAEHKYLEMITSSNSHSASVLALVQSSIHYTILLVWTFKHFISISYQ